MHTLPATQTRGDVLPRLWRVTDLVTPPPLPYFLHNLLPCQASMTPSRGPQAPCRAAPTRACQSLLALALTMGAARGFLFAPAAGGDLRRAASQSSSHRTGRIATSVRAANCHVDVSYLDRRSCRCCWCVCWWRIGRLMTCCRIGARLLQGGVGLLVSACSFNRRSHYFRVCNTGVPLRCCACCSHRMRARTNPPATIIM